MKDERPACPRCGETHVARIVYGHVTGELLDEVAAGRIVLQDGVASADSPKWHCNRCDYEWHLETEPRDSSVTNQNAAYQHTQTSPLSVMMIILIALWMICVAWGLGGGAVAMRILGFSLLIFILVGSALKLTVTGEESGLLLQYGPIPLFRKRIPYSSMTSVEAARTSLIDGWGIHYIPARGWTFNIWGFDCVLIRRDGKSPIRIGTDDTDGLVAFLRTRLGPGT